MDPERWHRVSDVFHRALDQDPADRDAFLNDVCGDDPDLRAEVDSLIAHHDKADGFLETPARPIDSSPVEATPSESLVGRTLHQYEVRSKLGQGGMGVVYLADDTRLGRPVAIKALTQQFTRDRERRERLRREARAAAALSHPGIATVYALEEFDNALFIVSEYVPGNTLRDEVTTSPLGVELLLDTAVQISRALAAAHQQGVVHRDLKPENVIRTTDGSIKVLDFGLARLSAGGPGEAPATTRLTEPGSMLGTPGYMPPEQLRGEEVDFRADIFSFGVLVYELLSGVHPFSAESPSSTIARVLEADPPDVGQLAPSCPPALNDLIRNCLQKEPARRYDSTNELVERLERIRRDAAESGIRRSGSGKRVQASPTKPGARRHPLWWWQFHQAAVGIAYFTMLIPVWIIRGDMRAPWGIALFLSVLAAVSVAAILRFHLLFTSWSYPTELAAQRARVARGIQAGDWAFVLLLLTAAGVTVSTEAALAALLVGVAIGVGITFNIIEPTTARAAFRRHRSKSQKPAGRRKSSPSVPRRS